MADRVSRRFVLLEQREILPNEHEDMPSDCVLLLRFGGNGVPRHDEMQSAFGGTDVDVYFGRLLQRQRLRRRESLLRHAGHGDV